MNLSRRIVLLMAIMTATSPCFSGCAYKQTRVSQEGMRETLLQLYQGQVMDNVIRTQQNLPILQLAYSNAVGQVTNQSRLAVSGGHQDVGQSAGSFGSVVSFLQYFVTGVAEQDVSDQISVVADPVNKPSITKAYQDYSAKIKLNSGKERPPTGTFHIARRFGDLYYFIDEKDRDSQVAFVELYNEVSQSEAPRPSKAFDQLLNEETKVRLNEMVK